MTDKQLGSAEEQKTVQAKAMRRVLDKMAGKG